MLKRKVPVFDAKGKVLTRIELKATREEVQKRVKAKVAFDAVGARFGDYGWIVVDARQSS